LAIAVAIALTTPTPAAFAAGGGLTDPCGDASPNALDLTSAELLYSPRSLQVRTESCGSSMPDGNWTITVHLTSFTPEVKIVGQMRDNGTYSTWSGFSLCADVTCPVDPFSGPSGTRMAGFAYDDNLDTPSLSGRSAFGYGDWSVLLPGVTIPGSIDYYVTTHQGSADVDRAPDAGTVTATPVTTTRASYVTPDPVPTAQFFTGSTIVTGRLTHDSASGPVLPNRAASLYKPSTNERAEPMLWAGQDFAWDVDPHAGEFATLTRVSSNTTFEVGFDGDGVNDPSPRATVRALVSAFVTLDLPDSLSWRLGKPVRFHGVVRSRQPGTSVLVQARSGGPGTAWRNWRTVPLLDNVDTYYSFTWTPSNTGRTTFRVLWLHGSTADGDVVNGMSNYSTITVT
jgi:hypothetical protein